MDQLPPDSNHPLIPILDRPVGDSVNAVDARELHRVLEVGRDFSTWIKERIETFGFVSGADFEVFHAAGENPSGGRPRIDYVIAIDAAKHIALAERNEKGRQVRAYFIAMEKRARDPMLALSDPAQLRTLLLNYSERVGLLEAENDTMRPKAEVYDRIVETADTYGLREAHKVLRRTTGVSERELTATLIGRGWAQRLNKRLQPAHYGEAHGYVTSRLCEWTDATGEKHSKPEFRITAKGVTKLAKVLSTGAA